jgi:hypothetical protein
MIHEYMETIPTLWKSTREWMGLHGITESPLLDFFLRKEVEEYNGCHFWSNFEIARTDLWNNDMYIDYFNYLDQQGGFFYERYVFI